MLATHPNYPSRNHQPHTNSFLYNTNPQLLQQQQQQQQKQQRQPSSQSQYQSTHQQTANFSALGGAAPQRYRPTATAAAAAAALAQIQPLDRTANSTIDLMPSDSWSMLTSQNQQIPRNTQRFGHNRDSSLSSVGSNNTPASPYNVNMANSQIAVADSVADSLHELTGVDTTNNYTYALAKPLNLTDNFYASAIGSYPTSSGVSGPSTLTEIAVESGLPALTGAQQQQSRMVAPTSDLSSSRSRPVSVASSIGGDSPATPSYNEPEDGSRRTKNAFANGVNIPKLDRTMTDIYSDELYNPHFNITSASPSPQTQLALSPSNELFAQRLQAANSQHLSAAQSPVSNMSRDRSSPFRQGSPYASIMHEFSKVNGNPGRLESAQQMRERRKAEQDAKQVQEQLARHTQSQRQQQSTPSTISPKDAVLEFNESEADANFPLFPPQDMSNYGMGVGSTSGTLSRATSQQATPSFQVQSMATPLQSAFNFSMPTNIQVPQQYPFITRTPNGTQQTTPSASSLSRMSSAELSTKDGPITKPDRTAADGGTYTCTYHGCTLRFETPALLQKHKREGHRQANTMNHLRNPTSLGLPPSSVANSQAGPHRCDRINPSTGKPCNTIFSRPYDLTRHEDTIHNARKQKVRCNICTEEKTFSRADALTRHYRVCHPDLDFPGKQRSRRGGGA
ncbi:hypothetical protein F5Y16DRAFT_87678 [Xylariaceae sp. FL0255]|nr:hypothetical protein F5Y16DRAFT_87678 [Xylariaceae sp. FL0255]